MTPPAGQLTIGVDGFALPLDAALSTFAVLAIRRAGKSNVGVVMAEEMHAAGAPFIVVDPKGDWWGIRSSADGAGGGLPVPILGGLHGDIPLADSAGAAVARVVAADRLAMVLDVSEFTSGERAEFLTAFFDELFRRNRSPLHLFLEECDRYLPQVVKEPRMAALVGAAERIVTLGGFRGIGCTLLSQRSAKVNKGVLTQCETLIALRSSGTLDVKAVTDWMRAQHGGNTDQIVEAVATLGALPTGEGWVSSPHWLPEHGGPALTRVRFRRRRTYDSGRTPTFDEPVPEAQRAPVDLDALRRQLGAVVEQATADDPTALRRRITDLERQVAARPAPELRVERVEVPVPALSDADAAKLVDMIGAYAAAEDRVRHAGTTITDALTEMADLATEAQHMMLEVKALLGQKRPAAAPSGTQPAEPAPAEPARPAKRPQPSSGPTQPLRRAERRIVAALHTHGPLNRYALALRTGYTHNGGGFSNAVSAVRTAGLIRKDPTGDYVITTEGDGAGISESVLDGPDAVRYWTKQVSRAAGQALKVLSAAYPARMPIEDIAAGAGYQASGGGFTNALSALRSLHLAQGYARDGGMTLTPEFAVVSGCVK